MLLLYETAPPAYRERDNKVADFEGTEGDATNRIICAAQEGRAAAAGALVRELQDDVGAVHACHSATEAEEEVAAHGTH